MTLNKAAILSLLSLALGFFHQGVLFSAEVVLSGREIAHNTQYRQDYMSDENTSYHMTLVNAQGDERNREFTTYKIKKNGLKKTLSKFSAPEDIRNTGTLNEEAVGSDDIQYMYLPAAKQLRRVSAKNKSWMGSDFNFEDIMETEFEDFQYEFLGTEAVDGTECYKYSMVPVSADKSMYSKQIRWSTKDTYLVIRNEFYDKSGKLLKISSATDLRAINGTVYAWNVVVENMQDGHKTILTRKSLSLDKNIPEDFVTTRRLQNDIETYDHFE